MSTLPRAALSPRVALRQQAAPQRVCVQQAALPGGPGPCCWPQQCRQAAAPRIRRQQRRLVAQSSSASPAQLAYQPGPGGSGGSGSSNRGQADAPRTLSDVIHWTINLPWQKAASWVAVAVVASQLRDFFGIMMGTFVVSFVGNGFVQSVEDLLPLRRFTPQKRRRLLVTAYFTAIVSLFTLFGVLIIPDVVREGVDFVSRLQTENLWVVVLEKMRKGLGEGVMDSLERFILIASSDDVTQAIDFAALDNVAANARTQVTARLPLVLPCCQSSRACHKLSPLLA